MTSPAPIAVGKQVVVRRCMPPDLEAVERIESESFAFDAASTSDLRILSVEHPGAFFVAEVAGDVVGYAGGSATGDAGEIESVAVLARLRSRGIGTLLMGSLLARFQTLGLRKCALQVRATNTRAISLYKRLGFSVVRTLDSYYFDGTDAFLMEKGLGTEEPTRPWNAAATAGTSAPS